MRSLPSLFALRRDYRAGRMLAVLDATSFDDLAGVLRETGLPHQSLFYGEDAEFLKGEAPYAVTLDPVNRAGVKRLLQAALYRHAGFVALTDAGQDDIRRHFKSWLTVSLGEEEGLAMFRFYDTRILLAFLATLGTTEAQAFFGPAETLLIAGQDGVDALDRPGLTGLKAPARIGLPKGQIYQINDAQMEAMTRVTDKVFRGRLAAYLRQVWPTETAGLHDQELADLISAAIGDCYKLEVCREMDVVIMSIARLRVPELVASDEFWRILLEQRPKPNGRAGTFISAMTLDMEPLQKNEFYLKVNGWGAFEPQGEVAE